MNQKKAKHSLKAIVVIMLVVLLMTSCRMQKNDNDDYTEDKPELYSVVVNSLPGSRGFATSERKFNSQIKLIEEDEFGRILFLYSENRIVSTYSLVISQTSDEEYVYFYPDYNFISISKDGIETLYIEEISDDNFLTEAMEELKRKNDWNEELDTNQCIKTKIVRKKEQGTVKNGVLLELYDKALEEDS